MDAKEIFLKIDSIITEKYKSRSVFCKKTNRTDQAFSKAFNNVVFKKGTATLKLTEDILNDLGYELTIQPITDKEVRDGKG